GATRSANPFRLNGGSKASASGILRHPFVRPDDDGPQGYWIAAAQRTVPAMTLKERLEENIVVLAVAVAIGTGGTVYGASAYFCQQHMDNAALAHQNDMSALTNKSDEEIRHIRHDYDEAITELKNRVSSIERRLGGEKYLDVNSLFRSKQ